MDGPGIISVTEEHDGVGEEHNGVGEAPAALPAVLPAILPLPLQLGARRDNLCACICRVPSVRVVQGCGAGASLARAAMQLQVHNRWLVGQIHRKHFRIG